ncbi:uncharacterized protein LOC132698404 isoform X2 [Cylas formicarius]|uniref:uncharacterized protein LOC132698404 isoform X2 n=1 Tax=Cylas formicarius TaxID=197179 RepID=UPI002958CD23|nr:uncharacterized protein LOC132698404 isoform X2 [Cylas formicarius]
MAALVSHAMHRFPTSPTNAVYSSYGLKSDSSSSRSTGVGGSGTEGALSRSMRYADPWLYGSVRGNPGGFLLAPALVLCTCPDYINGTRRPSKKSPHTCKKCKGTRLPLNSESKFGTVRCYSKTHSSSSTPLRAGTVHITSSPARPSILPAAPDPYDLMRRSRLSVPERTGSPYRGRSISPSSRNVAIDVKRENGIKKDSLNSTVGRRSILECNINPYELMAGDKPQQSNETKSVTVLNGQRIRVRPTCLNIHQDYEDVLDSKASAAQYPFPKYKPKSPVAGLSAKIKPSEEDYERNTIPRNQFKSILKKRSTLHSGTDSATDYEDATPSPSRKSGSQFYIPTPLPMTPRKKVQFLDASESDGSLQSSSSDLEEELKPDTKVVIKNEIEDEEEVFEDASEEPAPPDKNQELSEAVEAKKKNNKLLKLKRSYSDRLNNKQNHVVFHDTMALRSKKRPNVKITFSSEDLEKLDGITSRTRKISPRPHRPPPPPPPVQLCDKEKKEDSECQQLILPKPAPIEKADEIEISKIQEVPPIDGVEALTPPSAPPRKRSNNKQPALNVICKTPETQAFLVGPQISEDSNKTVVQISSSPIVSPTVHKIQIKNEYPDLNIKTISVSESPQRKTSILINGDNCYSTVNVNDNIPLYQSSVIVKDDTTTMRSPNRSSSKIYITGTFISSTDTANESEAIKDKLSETKDDILIVPDIREGTSWSKAEHALDDDQSSSSYHSASSHCIKDEKDSTTHLHEILRDPVEAVRQNLVPHVCGKSDMSRRSHVNKPSKTLDKNASLFESPLEDTNLSSSLEESFLRLRCYESLGDDFSSEHSSSTQYELMDPGSDSYTDHSNRSSVTEEELSNRTKFYELLADADHVEVSENEDHHYESIKINNDPIYEEIEIPPPLPANPPPLCLLDDLHLDKEYTTRSIFEGASKYDILSYLVDAKERGIVQEDGYAYSLANNQPNDEETKESYNRTSHMSTVSDSSEDNSLIISGAIIDEKATSQKPAEVERNDSGVGSETSKSSLSKYRSKQEILVSCEDCEFALDSKTESEPLLCRKCSKKRSERKEIITEIVETEEKYSKDLQIILEEFYQPMLVAGLLTPDQLATIFLNVEELLENSQALAERLRDAVEIALEQGDDDLLTVNIGKLFLEAAPMLHGFETYCVRQGTASLLLASLEKEKELLRIFLRVSQMENTLLRRMNLNSFLMVPVQRVTKYPLLLARLYKVTPVHHHTREILKEAQHKIELHLNHMNSETKDVPSKLWRRIGSNSGRRPSTEMDLANIKLRKIAVDVLEWNHDEAKFILEGKLLFTQPTDNNWRKGRTIKLTPINALLVTNGKLPVTKQSEKLEDNCLVFSKHSGVREAALLLVRDKNGRYSLLREPLYLDRCVVAADPAWQSYFEVQELMGKDTFIFKADEEKQTHLWYKQLQYHSQGLGAWRKRRNALANIMINGMGLRT